MSGWDARVETLDSGRVRRVWPRRDGEPLAYADVLRAWRGDPSFRVFFDELLGAAPFDAYLWETPPLRRETAERPFEFVQVDCPPLARTPPDPGAFAEHFTRAEAVATFPNLGGDATLIAPAPSRTPEPWGHLAAFQRTANPAQKHALWHAVGTAAEEQLGDPPRWISTSGLGIAWLHVRVETTPKYYTFVAYRN